MQLVAPGDDLVSVNTIFGVTPQQIRLQKKERHSLTSVNVNNTISTFKTYSCENVLYLYDRRKIHS